MGGGGGGGGGALLFRVCPSFLFLPNPFPFVFFSANGRTKAPSLVGPPWEKTNKTERERYSGKTRAFFPRFSEEEYISVVPRLYMQDQGILFMPRLAICNLFALVYF